MKVNFAILLIMTLTTWGISDSRKSDSLQNIIETFQEPTVLIIEASIFSYLILDSVPMGQIRNGYKYQLIPGSHRIQIHNIGCSHFDTTITLSPGVTRFKKSFPERENGIANKKGKKKYK
jgi:hypothetical protein